TPEPEGLTGANFLPGYTLRPASSMCGQNQSQSETICIRTNKRQKAECGTWRSVAKVRCTQSNNRHRSREENLEMPESGKIVGSPSCHFGPVLPARSRPFFGQNIQ
ncbi:hypothetical protein KXW25_003871, partial [Aspergillus fumigatus]